MGTQNRKLIFDRTSLFQVGGMANFRDLNVNGNQISAFLYKKSGLSFRTLNLCI